MKIAFLDRHLSKLEPWDISLTGERRPENCGKTGISEILTP